MLRISRNDLFQIVQKELICQLEQRYSHIHATATATKDINIMRSPASINVLHHFHEAIMGPL